MKKISIFNLIDIHIYRGEKTNKNYKNYLKEYASFKSNLSEDFEISNNYPCLLDKYDNAGVASGQYFIQDLYVAQQIYKNNPTRHVDIGSRIDGFVAHVACYREIEVFDIRPLNSTVTNIIFRQLDITKEPTQYYNYCDSISCLHALEHFGLGRYGDSIDVDGHKKGFLNISKILKPGGLLYLSVPISEKQRIEFNAHRIFCIPYILEMCKDTFTIQSISYIDDSGFFYQNIDLNDTRINNSFNCIHGCAIFVLKKRV